jgi:hypothetical protein
MSEEWRDVGPDYPGYEVSNCGRVRNASTMRVLNPWGHDRLAVGLVNRHDGKQHKRFVHELVLEAFVGPRPGDNYDGCHQDGDGHNNNLDNLRWDTHSNNIKEQHAHKAINWVARGVAVGPQIHGGTLRWYRSKLRERCNRDVWRRYRDVVWANLLERYSTERVKRYALTIALELDDADAEAYAEWLEIPVGMRRRAGIDGKTLDDLRSEVAAIS